MFQAGMVCIELRRRSALKQGGAQAQLKMAGAQGQTEVIAPSLLDRHVACAKVAFRSSMKLVVAAVPDQS